MSDRRQVAVVTGGGGGIGGAIAEELGRRGWFVVTVDPMVTLEGDAALPEPEETTAGRIVAAGGSARASAMSVTDGDAVRALLGELAGEHGGVDAVVNVAGITRQTYFNSGTAEDWLALLEVHLGGWLNMLGAALPLMAESRRGRILGVTSGSGWRAADAGAYSCAKRVVASLTWQLGRAAPPGVTVNAMSPIAATRMVAAAAERARQAGRTGGGGGGMSLFASMPGPDDLAPLAASFVGEGFGWCNGQVLFAGGSEVAVVDPPRLVEAVRSDAASLAGVLEAVGPSAFAAAEKNQVSSGGGNPRFGRIFDEPAPGELASSEVRTCALITDRLELAGSITAALGARAIACHRVDPVEGFGPAAVALRAAVGSAGPLDAVVVAPAARTIASTARGGWERVLEEHAGIIDDLHADAGWARAVADYAADSDRPVRLVHLVDATTAGGRSRAQARAQQARIAAGATEGRVVAFGVGVEAPEPEAARSTGELVAHLLAHPEAASLAGAELVVADGWLGLRSHPRPGGTVVYGGPALPDWVDTSLREIVGAGGDAGPTGTR